MSERSLRNETGRDAVTARASSRTVRNAPLGAPFKMPGEYPDQ